MDDLNRSFDGFNEWADANGVDDLTMYLLTPHFYSEDFEYDIVGMNFWPNGAAFGSGNAAITSDPDAYGGFEGVIDCPSHAMHALVGVKPPQQDVQDGGLFEFTNCTMQGNRSNDEGIAAVAAVGELFNRWDVNDAQAAVFNIAGLASDASYDFKWVTYYPSYESWGALMDGLIGDQAVQELGAIVDPVMQCDSSRIYGTMVKRAAAAE